MTGIWQIFARAFKSVKIGTLMGFFVLSTKCLSLKFTEELSVMTMKNDTKIEEELTCRFKIDVMNLTNLTRALKSLKNLRFNGLLVSKVHNV